jgi:RND family efflux transporter MFP subunit
VRRGWQIGIAAVALFFGGVAFVVLAGGVTATTGLWWWLTHPRGSEPTVTVVSDQRTLPVELVPRWPEGFVAVVLANETADLAPNVDGRLAEVRANVGDVVQVDDVVAVLEVGVADQRVEEARAALRMARAQRMTAAIDLRAAQQQVEQLPGLVQAISVQEAANIRFSAERAQAALAHADAEVAARSHQLEGLQATASEAVVTAPFSGRIAARFLDPGVLVNAQTPVLQLQATQFRVRLAMPLDAMSLVKPGQTLRVELPDSERTLTATVDRVSPTMNAASGMIFAEAQLEEAEMLVSGQPARAFLP